MIVLKSEHRAKPFRLHLGNKVYCVGGGFTVKKAPPALPLSLDECTQEDYRYLYDNGFANLFEVIQPEVKEADVKDEQETNEAKEDEFTESKSRAKHRANKSAS
jgi:hypothetical protein